MMMKYDSEIADREFKCVGLKETLVVHWNNHFKVGRVYKLDFDSLDDVPEHLRHMVVPLKGENGKSYFVDRDQFRDITNMEISAGDAAIRVAFILFICLLIYLGALEIISRI